MDPDSRDDERRNADNECVASHIKNKKRNADVQRPRQHLVLSTLYSSRIKVRACYKGYSNTDSPYYRRICDNDPPIDDHRTQPTDETPEEKEEAELDSEDGGYGYGDVGACVDLHVYSNLNDVVEQKSGAERVVYQGFCLVQVIHHREPQTHGHHHEDDSEGKEAIVEPGQLSIMPSYECAKASNKDSEYE